MGETMKLLLQGAATQAKAAAVQQVLPIALLLPLPVILGTPVLNPLVSPASPPPSPLLLP